eukprot:1137770-Pelagomonas_calceolata.AAC.15
MGQVFTRILVRKARHLHAPDHTQKANQKAILRQRQTQVPGPTRSSGGEYKGGHVAKGHAAHSTAPATGPATTTHGHAAKQREPAQGMEHGEPHVHAYRF